jgi:hypothetical protein
MKKIFFALILTILFSGLNLAQQTQPQKNDPTGIWKFDIPEAPEGYKSGNLNIAYIDNKYTATMFFPEYSKKINGENVSFQKDSLSFKMYTSDNVEVLILLKMTEPSKMIGKAVHYEGEIPLTMAREKK